MATLEVATESIDSVTFTFLTDEEVRKHSFVKITNPRLLDLVERPVPGGLYDPALGPLTERTICQTCGQRLTTCPGHCGHIELISPVYNPLLFNFLYKILQRTCFFCHHFRAARSQVERCVAQLELIVKGDIVGAKMLDSMLGDEILYPAESDGSQESGSTIHSGVQNHDNLHDSAVQLGWTSLQFTEAISVLYKFLKPKLRKCKNCNASNPIISKPTFGWFQKIDVSDASIRQNVIRNQQLQGPLASESEGMTDVEDADEAPQNLDGAKKNQKEKGKLASVEFIKQKDRLSVSLLPSQVKGILELLWQNEPQFCSFICNFQQQDSGRKKAGPSMFFLETILVPPIKFRPPTKGGDSVMEHPQTVLLSRVLQSNISLGDAHVNKEHSKIVKRWFGLQQSINVLFDGKTAKGPGQRDMTSGIFQLLEKKEGLFRQKMMGKRVNYACRSVISPDPYLGVNEIGIPLCFLDKLTYPERVTPWNIGKLRNAVINGSECHPGATHYYDTVSINKLPPSQKMRIAISRKLPSARGALIQSGRSSEYQYEGKIVYRHLQDGDVVLVNRQPTLHKPSIMAHVVRVLKGEKTLRMHYANCSTYNADFDGDEMNVHFPQDEISRAEAYNIVNANNQYVKPSNGEPIRALIQDHIVSAALLTKRDTFLSQEEYNQLLYVSGVSTTAQTNARGKPGQKIFLLNYEDGIRIPQPAILKPVPKWTGKQVINAVLDHITRGHPPFTVEKDGKIPCDFFKKRVDKHKSEDKVTDDYTSKQLDEDKMVGRNKSGGKQSDDFVPKGLNEDKMSDDPPKKDKMGKRNKPEEKESDDYPPMGLDEDKMVIFKNYFVRGVIDKAQFGNYGLVHTIQELFGPNTAGTLLSVLSRLFTAYLQMHGFTCGVDDLLIMESKDNERRQLLESCEKSGELVHRNFIGVRDATIEIKPTILQSNVEKTMREEGESAVTYLDRQMRNELNSKTSSRVINELLSDGLLKHSGRNCISLMTTSGAKGSKVNFQQISSFLGQQDLEGKRVPRMVSGKTLPSFHPWDWTARAGGYIIDRFLTGLRPQEYYFHCMAGREGLVDTAVKTSRSGYLQRCLIKNLECLTVSYDHTVRDADGSVIQFQYGEDGVDVHQTSFISKLDVLAVVRICILFAHL
uniref:DNA-directed RNA polymerase subunit n=1 Tax=Rhizophora mucronata TaxID=61149 RepID=A0A2P2KYW8_RHIMU